MSYDSFRNKKLLRFPDEKLMLLAEASVNNVTDWRGQRIWEWTLFHPEETLFYTEETLKQTKQNYVAEQLKLLSDFSKWEVEHGYAQKYEEPSIESHDYNGTRWPGGSRIKNGRAFYGGKPIIAQSFIEQWGSPKTITFEKCDKDLKTIAKETYNILQEDLDVLYKNFFKANGPCYINIR